MVNVKVGASVGPGIDEIGKVKAGAGIDDIRKFKELDIGNFVYLKLSGDKEEAIKAAGFCKKNNIYFIFEEVRSRNGFKIKKEYAHYSGDDFREIKEAGGEFFMGMTGLGEPAGMVYWPKLYLVGKKEQGYGPLPRAEDMKEAKENYVNLLKKTISMERKKEGGPVLAIESCLLQKYLFEAGADCLNLEAIPGGLT